MHDQVSKKKNKQPTHRFAQIPKENGLYAIAKI